MIPVLVTSGDPVTRDFDIFGQYWLTDCISCTVTEERNGIYDCQIVYPINGANYDQIENGTIVLCPHDNTLDRQPFVVYRRELNLDGTATLYLHHISYALNYIVTDSFPDGTTDALSSIFAGITATAAPYVNGFSASLPDDIGLYQFSADDDTETVLGFAMAHTFARSVRDLLIGSKESILSTLEHGEFEWDRYNVIFHNGPNGRGNDNGVAIRYGGTLTEARQTDDTESAYSGVVPYWIDPSTNKVVKLSTQGGRTVSVDEEAPEDGYFPGRYNRRLVPLDASQVFDSEPTPTQLRQYAEEYLGNLQPWQQYSNITINFVTQDTDSTDDYAELQGVRLCDTIHVSVAPFQAEYTAKIIKTVYNVLLERYDSVEIGQPQVTLSDIYGGTSSAAAPSAAPAFDPTQYYTKTETDDLLDDKVSTDSNASLRGLTTSSATNLGNGAVDIAATLLPAQSTTSVRGSLNVAGAATFNSPANFAGGITSVGGGALCTGSQRALGIQCGEYSASASVAKASTKEYEITFPVAFATGCVPIVVVSMMANSASAASLGNTVPYVMGTSRDNEKFTVKFFNNSTIAHTPSFTWVAIGEMEG